MYIKTVNKLMWREAQKRRDIYTHTHIHTYIIMTDWRCCITETKTKL